VSQLMTSGGREFQVARAAEGSFADVGTSERHIEKRNDRWPRYIGGRPCT